MRIVVPERAQAPASSQIILDRVEKDFGFLPNIHRLLSLSPNVLAGLVSLQHALSMTLDAKTRQGIALAVSAVNGCGYCLASHSHMAANMCGVAPDEIDRNRAGRSEDHKRSAAIGFARVVIETRGAITNDDFSAVRAAGYTDAQIIEIIALAAQFQFANFINNVAETEIDFPELVAIDQP